MNPKTIHYHVYTGAQTDTSWVLELMPSCKMMYFCPQVAPCLFWGTQFWNWAKNLPNLKSNPNCLVSYC